MLIGLFAWADAARAGGWATLTLSELPEEVVAERPFTVEFLLLQHGQTPVVGSDLFTEVRAVHSASGEQVAVKAEPMKRPGYYTATLVLPMAGAWQWEIEAFTAVYPMPPLTVNGVAGVMEEVGSGTAVPWNLVLGWSAAAAAIVCFYGWTRQPKRQRLVVAAFLGTMSLIGFVLHAQMPQAALAESATTPVPAIAPEMMGEALFVAKGCIQCHTNENVALAENLLEIGPDLTFVKRSPEYVALWLANPSDLKADTTMPNLHLSETEIDALVAFLYQD
ncbi:c-type cytochrome [Candidatus Leptofilum sp.]|uniref:c-type cytochrome n=1 Tax=Candidatus Leptofilum sp. TaxID=3241576 RepID=UPI003B5A2EC0